MTRKLSFVLSLTFVLVFAFSLVVTMHSSATASGPCDYLPDRPGCCILAIHCICPPVYSFWVCGYGVWEGNQCVKSVSSECPAPASCAPCP